MQTYFEAHKERMQRNHDEMIALAKEVIKTDSDIEVYINRNDNLQDEIVFFKGELINAISFHQVPYHWSGCGVGNHSGGDRISMPFDVNDVLTSFSSVKKILHRQPNDYFQSKKEYLNWCSYLIKLDKDE